MSWEDQGRQEHGHFGHGTGAPSDKSPGRGSGAMFDAGSLGQRIDAVAHTALTHMPRKDWHRQALSFDGQRLGQLRKAMTTWIGARSLSHAAFEARLVDPATSNGAIEKLRAAAEGVRTAQTHQDLAKASADLAGGMQGIGLDKWPRFLRDAADRADASGPAQSPIVLAQAVAPNTATDASPGGGAASAAASGGYVAENPEHWAGRPSVGTGECVPLVQKATGAPRSTQWRPGMEIQGNTAIKPGTSIATFDANGHYSGHAAIYLGQDEKGALVVDQWNNRDKDGQIESQHTPSERTLPFNDPNHTRINRGESYRVVE